MEERIELQCQRLWWRDFHQGPDNLATNCRHQKLTSVDLCSSSRRVFSNHAECVQGTNAHAVLTRGPSCIEPQLHSSALWHHKRFWHSPAPHPALHRAISLSGTASSASFQTTLSRPELGFLGQHQVLGQRVLASMTVAEVATAASAMLKQDVVDASVGSFGCVWGIRLIMQRDAQLQTSVQLQSGQLVVSCGTEKLLTGTLALAQVSCCSPPLHHASRLAQSWAICWAECTFNCLTENSCKQ